MPEGVFLPYEFADSSLELRPLSVTIDATAVDLGEVVDENRCHLRFAGREEWTESKISFELHDPNDQLSELLLAGERPSDAIDLVAVLRNSETRIRTGFPLSLRKDGKWTGQVIVRRDDHRGSSGLACIAYRRHEGRPDGRHAFRASERVASAALWTIYIDDKPLMPGGAIDGEWRHFATDSLSELRRLSDCPWFLDLRPGEHPRLFLNEGIEGLKRALEATQRIGRAARIRDVLSHSILQAVILTMSVEAIEASTHAEFNDLSGWKRNLLLALARLSDGQTEEICLERWLESWRTGDRALVLADFEAAVQRHLGVGDAARHLIRELEHAPDG